MKNETVRIEVTNRARSPRGFHDARKRAVIVDPGMTAEASVTQSTVERLSRSPVWAVGVLEEVNSAPALLGDNDDLLTMPDDEFATIYEARMGKAPHHRAKRETLIEQMKGA